MAQVIPPRPLSREQFNQRYQQLRTEFPNRTDFTAFELDPELEKWYTGRRRYATFARFAIAIGLGGLGIVGLLTLLHL